MTCFNHTTRLRSALACALALGSFGYLSSACTNDVVTVGKQDTKNAPLYSSSLECVPGGLCDNPEYVTFPDGRSSITPASSLCYYCECDSAGCHSQSAEMPVSAASDGIYYTFDIAIDGDRADGSVRNLLPDISASIGNFTERARLRRVA